MYTGNTTPSTIERDLGAVADAEPQHDQWLEPDDRQEAQHLHRRVHHVFAEPPESGDQREHRRDRDADREAQSDALERDPDRALQRAVLEQVPTAAHDGAGTGQRLRVDQAGGARELPRADEQHDAEQPLDARAAVTGARAAVSPSSRPITTKSRPPASTNVGAVIRPPTP